MRSRVPFVLAASILAAAACHKAPVATYGSTDTIRTGSPTSVQNTSTAATVGTAAVSTTAPATGYATAPTDTTASTRTK